MLDEAITKLLVYFGATALLLHYFGAASA